MSKKEAEQEVEGMDPLEANPKLGEESEPLNPKNDEVGGLSTAKMSKSLEEQLEEATAEIEKHKDSWLRATAELENVRKRSQADVAGAHKYALERFSTELLVVKDSLEAALVADNVTFEAIKDGVDLTLKQLSKVFETFGIQEIDPMGETLDPYKHQAMSALDSDESANTILSVFQKGYLLNDRLIRPALVSVAKSKE
ncbi:nucleotide exchange factor GrpE [Burkholderiales bacterium]|nr:nucleotide exchange factor GrpE [Burkholderiales bacterium]